MGQVEVELANLRNRLRQENEAVESVVDAGKQQQLVSLVAKQAERRTALLQTQQKLQQEIDSQAEVAQDKLQQELQQLEQAKPDEQVSVSLTDRALPL
jgi:hypothetical protein